MQFLRGYENRHIESEVRFFGEDEENGRLCWLTKPSVRLCLKRTTEKTLPSIMTKICPFMDSIGTKFAILLIVIWLYSHIWSLSLSNCEL